MNKFKPWKLLPIWLAVSAVVVIAGIILMALLGFNTAAEKPENTQLEVKYNITVVKSEELQDKLEDYCESVLSANGLSACDVEKTTGANTLMDTGALNFYFTSNVSAEKQAKVVSDLSAKIAKDEKLKAQDTVYLAWHTENVTSAADYVWRGAVAVGIVVALVYVGIRFGLGCALTGLAVSVHGSLFTLSVFALTRIPVYAAAPVWYGAVGALLSLALWLVYCIKFRNLKKESQESVDPETAVETVYRGAWKWVLTLAGVVAVIVLLTGLLATAGVRAMALPLLVAVVAALYSVMLLGPALHVYVRRGTDKLSRSNKPKYVGKEKKADK